MQTNAQNILYNLPLSKILNNLWRLFYRDNSEYRLNSKGKKVKKTCELYSRFANKKLLSAKKINSHLSIKKLLLW